MLNKCDHGVYLTIEERETRVAKYCTLCNPDSARIIAPPQRVHVLHKSEREVYDTDRYLARPVGARLAAAAEYGDTL